MGGDDIKRFKFDVTTTASVSIKAEHARRARNDLIAKLEEADATIVTGTDDGISLAGLRGTGDVVLLSIDSVNPVAVLEEELRSRRERYEPR